MNNTLVISQDWDFTRTREKGGETFAFHSAGTCPGYSIKISGWRLRKKPGAQITQDELFLRGLDELNRHLGDSVCPGRKGLETLKTKVKEKMFPPGGLMPPDWMSKMAAENQKAYEQEFLIELRRILFSPRVARLSVPLLTLIIRDSAEYRLDKEPWSHSGPPRELRHLAASGFDGQCPLGILARPPTGKYLWIVSKFKECAIELKWNRRAAIAAEFPWIINLEKQDGKKRNSADYARAAKMRRMVKNTEDRNAIKSYCATLLENGYSLRKAWAEVVRRAKSGNVGSKKLTQSYPNITSRIVRGITESSD